MHCVFDLRVTVYQMINESHPFTILLSNGPYVCDHVGSCNIDNNFKSFI